MHFIGIDLGTSAIKAVLVDENQKIVASTDVRLETQSPRNGWSEQDPQVWWQATQQALAGLRQAAGTAWQDVAAIGLSGQMHGAVVLDAAGKALRPAILWNDGRSTKECRILEQRVPDLGMISGVPAMPGFTAPKLLWLKHHEPELFNRIACILLPKDYLRLLLTGVFVTDLSDAAGTLWLDQNGRSWSADLVAASGITLAQLPPALEGTAISGTIRVNVADTFGLSPNVVVAAGAGDAAAGAVGIGALNEGDAFLSLGTSAQLFVATENYRPRPDQFLHAYCHAVPDRWFQMAAMLNGATCLQWIRDQIGATDIETMLTRTALEAPDPSALVFLPYLSGERTPHNDPTARGAFIGLGQDTTPSALVRAVLEGVAFSCVDAQACLLAGGTSLSALSVIGGGSQSAFWMKIVASALNLPLARYHGGETGPAYGAARLARIARTGEGMDAVCTKPSVRDIILPDLQLADLYAKRMPHYRDLYRRLKGAFVAEA